MLHQLSNAAVCDCASRQSTPKHVHHLQQGSRGSAYGHVDASRCCNADGMYLQTQACASVTFPLGCSFWLQLLCLSA